LGGVLGEAVRVGTRGRSPSEARTGLIENSSVPDRMPLAMPRGQTGRKSQTDHDECINRGYLGTCPARDTVPVCYRYCPRVPVGRRHRASHGSSWATLGLRVVSLVAYTTRSGER
jgi:hypothetical protein